jgi:hypothetical protein
MRQFLSRHLFSIVIVLLLLSAFLNYGVPILSGIVRGLNALPESADTTQVEVPPASTTKEPAPTITPSVSPPVVGADVKERMYMGATRLSGAKYFLPVDGHDQWRIYYGDEVSMYAQPLADTLRSAGFFKPERAIIMAFYMAADTIRFNQAQTYFVALPYSEKELEEGAAETSITAMEAFLKPKYFSRVNFMVVATDYDFNPRFVQYSE